MVCILITAGPTREYLDDVRFLANGSSGRMGHALAAAARDLGHRVLLVSGPVERPPPAGVEVHSVVSALEMQAVAEKLFPACQIVFGAAAVADYRPAHRLSGKPPRDGRPWTLELVPNPDILAGLGARKGSRIAVGFALQPEAEGLAAAEARGREKLSGKHLDLIVVNLSSAVGQPTSRAVLLWGDGRRRELPEQDKETTARLLVEEAVALWRQRNPERP